jgi:hypothetical protein
LRDVIELLNLCWRALDSSLKPSIANEKCKTGQAVIVAISPHVSHFVRSSDFTPVVKDLNHIQRRQFSDVWRALNMTVDHINGKSDFEGRAFLWLQTLRTQLSHLEIYLRTFNPTLADIFEGRKRANIDSRPLASHLEELVEKYEKTGTI